MKNKKHDNRYWETETGETIRFGKNFMRCFDKAGKLQFGIVYKNKESGEDAFSVKFVIDRNNLFSSDEAASYLRGTIDDWEEMVEEDHDGN